MNDKTLHSANGAPVVDNNNSLTAGPRGPVLMQDIWLMEKLAHFDRERIPERVVHAKGSGAYGTFTVTHDISAFSKADLFNAVGKQTPVFLRFSTVAGEKGAADAERDVRGFALKFYTEQGNWDLVGNNTPVFFIRDPLKFPDFIHTQKRDPRTNLRSATAAWDFWSRHPESLHQVTILFSDRGIPKSLREMNGYGSHTFSFINDANERFWVKFHFKTEQGHSFYTDEEAATAVGQDRETSQADLFNAIERGDFPRWKVYVQVMPEAEAQTYKIHPFDLTKVWPHSDYPLIPVGVLPVPPRCPPRRRHAGRQQWRRQPQLPAEPLRHPAAERAARAGAEPGRGRPALRFSRLRQRLLQPAGQPVPDHGRGAALAPRRQPGAFPRQCGG